MVICTRDGGDGGGILGWQAPRGAGRGRSPMALVAQNALGVALTLSARRKTGSPAACRTALPRFLTHRGGRHVVRTVERLTWGAGKGKQIRTLGWVRPILASDLPDFGRVGPNLGVLVSTRFERGSTKIGPASARPRLHSAKLGLHWAEFVDCLRSRGHSYRLGASWGRATRTVGEPGAFPTPTMRRARPRTVSVAACAAPEGKARTAGPGPQGRRSQARGRRDLQPHRTQAPGPAAGRTPGGPPRGASAPEGAGAEPI